MVGSLAMGRSYGKIYSMQSMYVYWDYLQYSYIRTRVTSLFTKPFDNIKVVSWVFSPLRWRHNGHNSVSNHQPYNCLLNCLFRHRSNKTLNRVSSHEPSQNSLTFPWHFPDHFVVFPDHETYYRHFITALTLILQVIWQTSNGSWRQGIKGEMTCTVYVALVWNIIYWIIMIMIIIMIITIIIIIIIITIMIIIIWWW